MTEHYWFATSYVFLCLMMPFLNAGISCLDQKELRYLLLGFLLIFSVAKTVIPMQLPWDKYGYDSLWFVVLYLTGAYLRRYELSFGERRWRAAALYLGSVSAIFASFVLLRLIYLKTGMLESEFSIATPIIICFVIQVLWACFCFFSLGNLVRAADSRYLSASESRSRCFLGQHLVSI